MKHQESTQKTKELLAASLKNKMAVKPFEKITVSEIISDCNLNRKTFYYHFTDIYDLLKWMLEQETFLILKNFDLLIDYEDAICFVINYVKENAHILNCAYNSIGRDELKRFFYNDFVSVVKNVVDNTEKKCGFAVDDNFKLFICDFLTEATAGMLVNGFKDKCKLQQKDIIKNTTVIINSLPDILAKAPKKQ